MPRNVKETQPQANYDTLLQRIRASLSDANSYTQRNKRLNSRSMIIIIAGSALAAFITAFTAVEGPTVIPGLLDWKVACTIGAVLSFVTTVCSGLSQQLNISQKLVLGSQCTGRLRALELVAATQTRPLGEIANEYAEILRSYAETVENK